MTHIRGILLAGGIGSRLSPLTKSQNKHFLPVYNKRMIEYPLSTLVDAGITDVVVVLGGNEPGSFVEYLKDGSEFGLTSLAFTYQQGNGGVAAALKCAEPFINPMESVMVVLGDNYFADGIKNCIPKRFPYGAGCILKETDSPWEFGIAEVADDKIISIEEKPVQPKSNLAIVGAYFLDYRVWGIINDLKPSARGELEITDILRVYMQWKELTYAVYPGYWKDLGSFQNWMEVSVRIARQ